MNQNHKAAANEPELEHRPGLGQGLDAVIAFMKQAGWQETPAGIHLRGRVSDDDYFDTWLDAIKSCVLARTRA